MINNILLISDAHISCDQNLEHIKKIGNLVVKIKPEYIIQMGDWCTFDSLSAWDKNKRLLLEGKRYAIDCAISKKAIDLLYKPLYIYNKNKQRHKKKKYIPKTIWLLGNHEYRVDRYIEQHPELAGHLNHIKDQGIPNIPNVTIIPYKKDYILEKIAFTHVPINKNAQPVQGKYAIHRASELYGISVVFGHTHRFEIVHKRRKGIANLQHILTTGMSTPYEGSWIKGSAHDWWSGIIILKNVNNGRFSIEGIDLKSL